ncbi:MAG: hypothetical protein IJF94_04815 [Eubacterium sp.]|nr:hypothetical protein [Eubacterium sp.]
MIKKMIDSKKIYAFKKCMIPSKQSSTLAMYQRIISIGFWISIICVVLSTILFINKKQVSIFPLLIDFLVGIFCSMVVVIVTSILQFQKIRNELFQEFYSNVFLLTRLFKLQMDSEGILNSNGVKRFYEDIEDAKNKFDLVAFNLFWFTKEKSFAHLKVIRCVLELFEKTRNIAKYSLAYPDGDDNLKQIDSIVTSMQLLSKKYYPDDVNVFGKNNWW